MILKISAKIGILRSHKIILPIDTLKLFYNAIILPHFDYSYMVHGSASDISKLRLQKPQTRVANLFVLDLERAEILFSKNWGGYLIKIEEISTNVL